MRSIKQFASVIFCVLLLASAALGCFADIPSRPASGHIRDTSYILTSETLNGLEEVSSSLTEKNDSAIFLLTVDSFDGKGTGDYAFAAFDEWGLGGRDILVVVNASAQDYYAIAGEALSAQLSSEKIRSILASSFEQGFAAGSYDAAARSLFNALSAEISGIRFETSGGAGGFFVTLILVVLIILIALIVFVFIMRTVNVRRAKKRRLAARRASASGSRTDLNR